ncbi:(-)-kolavenyl diphosphate synthase TPS28, chloroplastic isoform X2 [Punica granatum]|uniref:(-)-kolavenyl diphosphate synthase TPS28, chloroplastic isoform X2 n=1 Tax=Punica granatum TaxID=22663 RepID=A0A6P8DPP7_PUNGR|nr:(-)-kolavenyl diphosphate synthase TPS28, chloroplastic isoform X2 [Punica granatum]
MSFHSMSLPNPSPTITTITNHLSPCPRRDLVFGVLFSKKKDKQNHFDVRPRCNAVSKPRTQGYDVLHNGLPVIKWQEIIEDEDIEVESFDKISLPNEIEKRVDIIKSLLESMNDGEISISAYDTAWVALLEKNVRNSNGNVRAPQFPESLRWIADNQLPDGSWGDSQIFSAHDRIINTIACVVALQFWNVHPEKCEKGMLFFKENLSKLEDENAEHMPIGFEVAFPSILEMAQKLEIEVPEDSPVLKRIYAKRNLKLSRIPKEILHKVPTTLLHSLEGMGGLDWEKLLKLQSPDGSFLFSPASTAYALMQTQDPNCFHYLKKAVDRFDGGVPNVYPVDLFEHLWVVDRLQRLGISRYFHEEIKEYMNYVHRYWTDKGICWARNSPISDLDDTAMGFRLLRLHGHQVSANVFEIFKNGSKFETFVGQSTEAVTGMFNLYRASHVQFPGETILDDAKEYAINFLTQKRAANQLLDKWIITKDLSGEVGCALDIPWYASLRRLETRFYIGQYGGDDDVWIGKTLYRMLKVNNDVYLELAKLDYNECQALHLSEWDSIQRWYLESEIGDFRINTEALLFAYFVAAASIFEPERAGERLAWAKALILVETVDSFFSPESASSRHQRRAFVREFQSISRARDYINRRRGVPNRAGHGLIGTLLGTLNQLSLDVLVGHGRDIYSPLHDAWEKWLMGWGEEGDKYKGLAELLVQTISLGGGRCSPEELLSLQSYGRLSDLSNHLCRLLGRLKPQQVRKWQLLQRHSQNNRPRNRIHHARARAEGASRLDRSNW